MPTVNIEQQKLAALVGDVGLFQTTDGMSLINLWLEVMQPAIEAYNATSNAVAEFIGSRTDLKVEQVTQSIGSKWQKRTEITKGINEAALRSFIVRYATKEYKGYSGHTRDFLTRNSSEHISTLFTAKLKALQQQKYEEITGCLYNTGARTVIDDITHETLKLYGLVDGSGNMPIPSNGTNTFASNHSHYTFVDSDSTDWSVLANRQNKIKALIRLVTEHGYRDNLVLVGNAATIDEVKDCPGYRALITVSPFAQSPSNALEGTDVQAVIKTYKEINKLFRAVGTLENATVMESDILPIGYLLVFSHNGLGSPENPVGYNDSPVITFTDSPWPFYETMMETSFFATIRKRLNGAVMYLATDATVYVNPTVPTLAADVGDWNGQ